MTPEFYIKVGELAELAKNEMSDNTVCLTVVITGTGFECKSEERLPENLKRDRISMRNLKGEFI